MKTIEKVEVLCPAGDRERLEAAIRFGADAVYLGGPLFNMRASTRSFVGEELKEAVDYVHSKGKKVYLTCNTLLLNEEVDKLEEYLLQVNSYGVDALIISDIGVLGYAHRLLPDMELHISTQAGVTNYLTANELYRLGAKRVVLARELSLEDIRTICNNIPEDLDVEVFVHGAMCMSFSGRCLLSQYMTGRDANRGACAQPCRWKYSLVEEKRPGQFFPIEEREEGSYILNAKDLCLIEYLGLLQMAGVKSFKIEGRAKSAYYVAVAAGAYRRAADICMMDPVHYQCPVELTEEVKKISHREYCTGFLFGRPEEGQCYQSGGYIRSWEVAGIVTGYNSETGRLICEQRNKFLVGENLELVVPLGPIIQYQVNHLYDEAGSPINDTCHSAMVFQMDYPNPLAEGTLIRYKV